jgi:hypothetical protein
MSALTEQEKQEIIRFIEAGKSLPDKSEERMFYLRQAIQ